VLAWVSSSTHSLVEQQAELWSRLSKAVSTVERAQPLFFTRAMPELDAMLTACTIRDSADGRSLILRTLHGDTKVTHFVPELASSPSPHDDPKARLSESGVCIGQRGLSQASDIFVFALHGLLLAIDQATWSDAARRVPLPSAPLQPPPLASSFVNAAGGPLTPMLVNADSSDAKAMHTAAQARAILQRDYPLLNVTMDDAERLITMRQATLRVIGAILLSLAAESSEGASSARVLQCLARASALQTSCRKPVRDLEQVAWGSAPLWLTRRSPALCLHSCDAVAALTLWGNMLFGGGGAHDDDDDDGVDQRYLLSAAHFANPHLLHYVARLRSSPAQCGLPVNHNGTDRRASAWFAAVRVANDARKDEGRELREPWTSDAARDAARALLTAPFDAANPLHAASVAQAERARAAAAAAYARGADLEAAEAFGYALAVAPWADATKRAALLSSRAQCALRASMPAAAVADCTASLALRGGDAKTLLRRAHARSETGDADGAAADLAAARS